MPSVHTESTVLNGSLSSEAKNAFLLMLLHSHVRNPSPGMVRRFPLGTVVVLPELYHKLMNGVKYVERKFNVPYNDFIRK